MTDSRTADMGEKGTPVTLPAATTEPGGMTRWHVNCSTCGMLLPAERPVFHPHVYCMLIKAGVREPERYMAATMSLLVEHFCRSEAES